MLRGWHCCAILLVLVLQTLASNVPDAVTYRALPSYPLELVLLRDRGYCTIISLAQSQPHRLLSTPDDVIVDSQPLNIEVLKSPYLKDNSSEKLRLIGHDSAKLWKEATALCPGQEIRTDAVHQQIFSWPYNEPSGVEIYPLVISGPSTNRVDLTFFSDGYTINEKTKFLADSRRLALDMSENQTFATVRPLMNFWAAFTPSRESGIGVGGVPRDTAFGLYRDGSELRAVYCSKKEIARSVCLALRSQCDYPILLGNDPLYGGLGGEFTISTASELNGALVLRHELGHSIIGVGEEYDGGFAYFGVNAAQNNSREKPFPWDRWLSSTSKTPDGYPRAERAVMSFQSYPWTFLNKTSSWSTKFSSSGLYTRYLVRFSLSGLPRKEDLEVRLDGKDIGWRPRPDVKLDRWHYDLNHAEPLTNGMHELSFTPGQSAIEGTAQLCSAEIIEYGSEDEFNSTVGYYGAFPTFSNTNTTTFRPTNEQCLMRIVSSPNFCHVCLEGLWMSLLKRVSLLDAFTIILSDRGVLIMDLSLVPFGQMRESGKHRPDGEVYTTVWMKDGVQLPEFTNMTKVIAPRDAQGYWKVNVQLHTREVRADPNGLLKQWATVRITNGQQPKITIGD